jgi:threonine aldolase
MPSASPARNNAVATAPARSVATETGAAPAGARPTFASDNTAGVCPEAWAALEEANRGSAASYGEDPWTQRAKALLCELFETECEAYFVFNGTAANALALSALAPRYASILCHEIAHIETDECGAPEFFSGGSKVIPVPGPGGKLEPAAVRAVFGRGHGVHFPKPGALSLTQSTEWGTIYRPAEIRALAELAHEHGLGVHMDGARFANAAAALGAREGASPADLTWRSGVDVLSFGGTKNGMLGTEAVVFFNRTGARDFAYRVKQSGQLASKQRYAGAQWAAMLESGAWRANAARANAVAARLAAGVRGVPGVRLMLEPEVNAVFVEMPPAAAAALQARGWTFHRFIGEHGYRLMGSWATRDEDVAALLADVRALA